jgi:uncharacterized membrane protein YdbT with pleckstrin-like domain
MNNLHPGVKWLSRLSVYPLVFFLGPFMIFPLLIFQNTALIITSIIITPLLIIILAEVYARMSYNRWHYEITNEGIKLEHGIIWKKYSSIPYERIQNVDLHRGIFARMFGFTTLEIETAGSSGYMGGGFRIGFGGGMRYGRRQRYKSEGHIPGVSQEAAEKIRDHILKKITKKGRKQGL